jgi:predicted AlkP superfamily pyrophosphatase or phosphodiesterase
MRIPVIPLLLVLLLPGLTSSAPVERNSAIFPDQTVLLIGLDGFHPSYLERPASRHLRELAEQGVRARWLVPVFPTLTFPNFYSIATGLYPEHHGIVSNTIKDTSLGRFSLRDRAAVQDPRWWGGEPIWVTAVKQGKRAATYFWPGSEAPVGGVHPTYYKLFDAAVPDSARVRQVLDWLSLPEDQAPSLITLYLGDVDEAGHRFGPGAPETDSAIAAVDSAVGALMLGIKQRSLSGRVNLIVVSDHGMAEVAPDHFVYLDDFIDTRSVDLVDLGPIVSLSAPSGTEEVYRRLARVPHLRVYRKNEIPAAFHYRASPRIQPIVAVADESWMVVTRRSASRNQRPPRGMHGYPPELASMRAVFLASGPAFARGAVVAPFRNIHIYDLIADVLGLTPAANDGSLDSVSAALSPLSRR